MVRLDRFESHTYELGILKAGDYFFEVWAKREPDYVPLPPMPPVPGYFDNGFVKREPFTVEPQIPLPPELIAPLEYTPDITPKFEWTPTEGAETYELLVYNYWEGQEVLYVQGITDPWYISEDPFCPALHQAFMRAVNLDGASDWSTPHYFTVTGKFQLPGRPEITSPEPETDDNTPTFEWIAAENAESYQLWIFDVAAGRLEEDFSGITTTSFTISNWWHALGRGRKYQVFVRGFNSCDVAGPWSAPWEVTIGDVPPVPMLTGPENPTSDITRIFTWDAVSGANTYELLVYHVAQGREVIHETGIVGTSYIDGTDLISGEHQAFLKATNRSGTSIWSVPYYFDVTTSGSSVPGRPILTGPEFPIDDTTQTFTWDAVSGADTYELLVYHVAQGKDVIYETGIEGTSYTISTILKAGQHQAFLKATNRFGSSVLSGPYYFTINVGIQQIPFTSPTNGTESNDSTPTFNWTAAENAETYELKIYDLHAGRLVRQYSEISMPSFTVSSIDLLRSGRPYQAFVRAHNSIGAGPWSQPLHFDILASPHGAHVSAVSFSEPIPIDIIPGLTRTVAVADFNGDSILDLAVPYVSESVAILLGNGDGTFQNPVRTPFGGFAWGITTADFNNDGTPDLVVASEWASSSHLLIGNGDGTFQDPLSFGFDGTATFVTAVDLDNDGNQDLVIANNVFLGNGDDTFQTMQSFATDESPDAIAVADINTDGHLDIVFANSNGVGAFLGNGDGTFQTQLFEHMDVDPTSVAISDFDSDGRPDLVVVNRYSVGLLLGNGDGTFASPVNYAVGSGLQFVTVGDLNGDGHQDLAVSGLVDKTVSVMLGNGDSVFEVFPVGVGSLVFAMADFNQDGRPDLAVRNPYNPATFMSILLQVPMENNEPVPTTGLTEPLPLFIFDSLDAINDRDESAPDPTPVLDQWSDAVFTDDDVASDDSVAPSDENPAPDLVAEDEIKTDSFFTNIDSSLLDELLSVF